jgi:hypothetical protein
MDSASVSREPGIMAWQKWVAENLTLGGIVRNVGSALGSTAKVALSGVGVGVQVVGRNSENASAFRRGCESTGESIDAALTVAGEGVGFVVNKTLELSGRAVGGVAAAAASGAGLSVDKVNQVRTVGTVIGTAGVGLLTGMGVTHSIAVVAAHGLHGAAATTAGLAHLGGGSVASGGGGMALGQVVSSGAAAGGAVSGMAVAADSVESPVVPE